MNDKIKINLQIADSNYPLTINREEEEMVREAAKQVNIRLNAYREYYKNLEPEKIIAMVAYQFSLEKLQLMQRNDTTPYTEKVKELTELLEDYFKKEWIFPFINHKFENREFHIPLNYDKYLTQFYGDYLTPPPEEKRTRHSFKAYYVEDKDT